MKVSADDIAAMRDIPTGDIASWLAQGFLDHVRGDKASFLPYSFVLNAPRPAEAIQSLFTYSPEKLRMAIHLGIEKLGTLCRVKSPESHDLLPRQRLILLRDFLKLCTGTVCFPAAETIARIACEDHAFWDREVPDTAIYESSLITLEDIALQFNACSMAVGEDAARQRVEKSLSRLAVHRAFEPGCAPRLFEALISITPDNLIAHLRLLGDHISTFHRTDEKQRALAYLTARRVVTKALDSLVANFPRLDLAPESNLDGWLVHALLEENGPLRRVRSTTTADGEMQVYVVEAPASVFTLKHANLLGLVLPPGELPPGQSEREGQQNEFGQFRSGIEGFKDRKRMHDIILH